MWIGTRTGEDLERGPYRHSEGDSCHDEDSAPVRYHLVLAVPTSSIRKWLDAIEIPTTSAGYAEPLTWTSNLGTGDQVGIEGTGSHGTGLSRWLTARGPVVVEVERPDRKMGRSRGKSDLIDAESAARKALSGTITDVARGLQPASSSGRG